MTVVTTSSTTGFLPGNGATTVFNYNFIIPFLSDGVTPAVAVTYKDAVGNLTLLPTNAFTISGVGNPLGGSVTYNPGGTPIASGTFLKIDRTVPYTQPDVFPNQGFLPTAVEAALDNLEEQIQQLADALNTGNVPVASYFNAFRLIGGTPGRMPLASEIIFEVAMYTGDSLASTGAYGPTAWLLECDTAPQLNWTCTLKKNGVSVGTGTINAGAQTGAWTFNSPVTFATGDKFSLTGFNTQDATLVGVSFTILGSRTF